MEIDSRFPTRLNTVSDAPQLFHAALAENLSTDESIRFLVYAPAFATETDKTPATVLVVTGKGWLVALQNEEGGVAVQKSDFSETLLLELKSILLLGQLRISFAAADTSYSVAVKFDAVGDEFYIEAADLILGGIDPALAGTGDKDRHAVFESWPMKVRNEAQRYLPKEQRLLAAVHWPSLFDGQQQQLAPAGALLITEREVVVLSGGEKPSREPVAETFLEEQLEETIGEVVTFVPRVRLKDFQVIHQDGIDTLSLQIRAAHGSEKLEIRFSPENGKAISEAMGQMLGSGSSSPGMAEGKA
jgi:hypothetical protein